MNKTNLYQLFRQNGYLKTKNYIFRVEMRLNSTMLVIQSLDEKMSFSFALNDNKVDDLFYEINEYYGSYFLNNPDHYKERQAYKASDKTHRIFLKPAEDKYVPRELVYSDNNNYFVITLDCCEMHDLFVFLFSYWMQLKRKEFAADYLNDKEYLNTKTWYEKRKFRNIKQLQEEEKQLITKREEEYRKALKNLFN